jgi:hypothetical protein
MSGDDGKKVRHILTAPSAGEPVELAPGLWGTMYPNRVLSMDEIDAIYRHHIGMARDNETPSEDEA